MHQANGLCPQEMIGARGAAGLSIFKNVKMLWLIRYGNTINWRLQFGCVLNILSIGLKYVWHNFFLYKKKVLSMHSKMSCNCLPFGKSINYITANINKRVIQFTCTGKKNG